MNIGPTSPDYAKYMLKWFTIWKIYSKIYSTLCPISHHYVTTFEVDGTASSIDNEYPNNFCHVHMIFTWSNKIAKFYSKDWISRSCHSNAFFEKNILWIKKDKQKNSNVHKGQHVNSCSSAFLYELTTVFVQILVTLL